MKFMKEKKYFALLILGLIALFLLYASVPFWMGISGAAILYVLLKKPYLKIFNKTNNKVLSAAITILLSLILIVIPILYMLYLGFIEFTYLVNNIPQVEKALAPFLSTFQDAEWDEIIRDHIDTIAGIISNFGIAALQNIISLTLNIVIMYLILYYALTEHKKAAKYMRDMLPFNEKNSSTLMKEFTHVVNVTFIGNGAASIVLGFLLAAAFFIFGFEHIFFWFVAGTIMAFVPIIGIQVIWIPAGLYKIITGDPVSGIGILIWGAFLSYIFDGYVRQKVQRDVGELHPLISLIGMIIGVMYFGITGIIIGPLVLAVFVLMTRMFREEYLEGW